MIGVFQVFILFIYLFIYLFIFFIFFYFILFYFFVFQVFTLNDRCWVANAHLVKTENVLGSKRNLFHSEFHCPLI